MATLTVDVPDELAEEFNRLFADIDRDALVKEGTMEQPGRERTGVESQRRRHQGAQLQP
jgi:hypothetical protein